MGAVHGVVLLGTGWWAARPGWVPVHCGCVGRGGDGVALSSFWTSCGVFWLSCFQEPTPFPVGRLLALLSSCAPVAAFLHTLLPTPPPPPRPPPSITMASPMCMARLRKEYRTLSREPPPHITARPVPSNILRWLFVIEGPPGTPYAGGIYVGRLEFPKDYPFHPPTLYMHTPSGRFETGVSVCMSMTSAHVESWNPIWGLSTILSGFLSFMTSDEMTAGAIRSSDADKARLARKTHAFNRKDKTFRELFPEFVRSDGGADPVSAAEGEGTAAPAGSSGSQASPPSPPGGASASAPAPIGGAAAPAAAATAAAAVPATPAGSSTAGGAAAAAPAPAPGRGAAHPAGLGARAGRGGGGAAVAVAATGVAQAHHSPAANGESPLALVGWLTVLVAIITVTYKMILA